MSERFDLIIVGGGQVGLSLAAALSRFAPGLRLVIVDRGDFSVPQDGRASALAAGVIRVFETIGVWAAMAGQAAPISRMKITDSGKGDLSRPLFLSFAGDVAPGQPFAHMVPNMATLGALLAALGPDVTRIGGADVTGFSAGPGLAEVQLGNGRVLTAPLVVAADGVRSGLRDMAGIGTTGHDYGQFGIVTTIAHELPHENTAYEHFRPAGPFASLPLPGNRSSLVFTERTADAEAFKALVKAEQEAAIEAAMGSSLGAVQIVAPVQVYPLRLRIARSFFAPRLALIGDAAHVVHPIAGQGLNLGVGDVAALAEVIVTARRLGQDIGSVLVLEDYARMRRMDTALMALVTDGMNRLFSNDVAPVRALRDLGLGIVDRLDPVKSALIRHAAGVGSGGPKLLRGLPI